MHEQSPSPRHEALVDMSAVMDSLGHQKELFSSLVEIFIEDYETILEELTLAAQAEDSNQVRHAAHTLKGLVANFYSLGIVALLESVEQAGSNQDVSFAVASLPEVKRQCDALAEELKRLRT